MRQKSITAIKHMGNRIPLVLPECNIGIHAAKADMTSVIFTGSGRIEQLIIGSGQIFPALWVFPYPVTESILDCLLFLLCQRCFFFIENTFLFPIGILNRIIDTNIFQIQCFFQDAISIGSFGSIGHICRYVIIARRAFSGNFPFRSIFGELYFNIFPEIKRSFKRFLHELLDIPRRNPGCPKAYINFRSVQIFRLCFLQSLHIDFKGSVILCCHLGNSELTPYLAGKILIGSLPAGNRVIRSHRVFEDDALQFCLDRIIFAWSPQKFRHIGQIHLATLTNGNCQRFRRGVHILHLTFRFNGTFGEHIRLAFQLSVLIHIFQ